LRKLPKKCKKIPKKVLTKQQKYDIINTTNEGNEGKPHLIMKGNEKQ